MLKPFSSLQYFLELSIVYEMQEKILFPIGPLRCSQRLVRQLKFTERRSLELSNSPMRILSHALICRLLR
ncbi:hypothetical protein CIK52_13930 [Kocuria rosea]|nr:hypothetical protein CIK52_13930 [Kocuria rosea]